MSRLVFKPEDFDIRWTQAAMIAQELFDRWLSQQPVVYGDRGQHEWCSTIQDERKHIAISSNFRNSHFKARLVCIEPLTKCDHPIEKCISAAAYGTTINSDGSVDAQQVIYRCECGAKVKPSAFEAVE